MKGKRKMTTQATPLTEHRARLRAAKIRRLLALKAAEEEREAQFFAAPATTWLEAGKRASYLIGLLAATPVAYDPRRKTMITNVLEDLSRLSTANMDSEAKMG